MIDDYEQSSLTVENYGRKDKVTLLEVFTWVKFEKLLIKGHLQRNFKKLYCFVCQ